jgi:hypothetical protein
MSDRSDYIIYLANIDDGVPAMTYSEWAHNNKPETEEKVRKMKNRPRDAVLIDATVEAR